MCLLREAVACARLVWFGSQFVCRIVSFWWQRFAAAPSVHSLASSLAVLGTAFKRGSRWGQSFPRSAPRCRPWASTSRRSHAIYPLHPSTTYQSTRSDLLRQDSDHLGRQQRSHRGHAVRGRQILQTHRPLPAPAQASRRRASQWPHSRSLNPTTPFVWFTSGKVADSLAGGKSSHDFDDPCRPTGSPTPAPQRPQPAPLCRASCAPSFFLSLTHPGVVGEAEALSSQCRRRCSKLVSRSDREPRFPS